MTEGPPPLWLRPVSRPEIDAPVEPLRLLRSQFRFSGLEELVEQIGRDADQARQICAAIVPDPDPWNPDG